MLKQSITIKNVCDILNELIKLDQKCAETLVSQRVPCNESVADHPTIQVHQPPGEKPSVGLLGILNGLFGIQDDGFGALCAEFDDDNKLRRFKPMQYITTK